VNFTTDVAPCGLYCFSPASGKIDNMWDDKRFRAEVDNHDDGMIVVLTKQASKDNTILQRTEVGDIIRDFSGLKANQDKPRIPISLEFRHMMFEFHIDIFNHQELNNLAKVLRERYGKNIG